MSIKSCKLITKQYDPGKFIQQGTKRYRAFQPAIINRSWRDLDPSLLAKLGTADRYIGRLDAFSDLVNVDLYVKMHVTKEATLSAKIEGTQTSVQEALLDRQAVAGERRNDWEEVNNYVAAINQALVDLEKLPLSSRLIRRTHRTLMQGVRGASKGPGVFRTSQNWIGGSGPTNATFVPPPPGEVNDLMSDLEKFIHNERTDLPELLKAALLHYQFETIHPFQDGNGRLGRLLIPLYLIDRKILRRPVLYLSAFFEGHRQAYYDHLTQVRTEGKLTEWFHFFLDGIIATARDGVETFNATLQLEKHLTEQLQRENNRSSNIHLFLSLLFAEPIVSASTVAKQLAVTPATAYKLIADFARRGWLREVPVSGRGKRYAFAPYLDLFSEAR